MVRYDTALGVFHLYAAVKLRDKAGWMLLKALDEWKQDLALWAELQDHVMRGFGDDAFNLSIDLDVAM
jgi:hypothetical protein